MGFEGSLDSVSFSDILNTLCKMKKEGTLVVSNDKNQKIVHFLDNGVTLIGDNQISLIGERLVQDGKLKDWQLENALQEHRETGKELEIVLLEQGLVSEEEIEALIYEYMEEEICDIFFWENARFSFTDGPPPSSLVNENKMTFIFDVQSLLFRIAEQLEEWNQIREKVPSLDIVFVIKENVAWADGALESEFKQLRELLDGTHDVRDIIKITNLSVIAVCRLFSLMLLQNLIQPAEYEDFISRSEIAHSKGKVQLQIQLLKKALALNPNEAALMFDIAKAYESISNRKLACEWFFKTARATEDIDDSIKYAEIAVRYDHNSIEPHKELLSLFKQKNNTDKILEETIALIRAYRNKGLLAEAIELCEDTLIISDSIVILEELTNLYIESQDSTNAFTSYNKLVAKTNKDYPDLLTKVGCIPTEDKVVSKEIQIIQRSMEWEKKRGKIYAISMGSTLLAMIIGYAIFYELSARSNYQAAIVYFQTQNYEKAKKVCNEIISSYSWSSVAGEAQEYIERVDHYFANIEKKEKEREKQQLAKIIKQIDSVKEFVKIGLFDEAKIQLEKYNSEYNSPRWISIRGQINHHIEGCKLYISQIEEEAKTKMVEETKQHALLAEKEGNIDEALKMWQKLLNHSQYVKEAQKAISRIEKSEISLRKEHIKKVFLQSEEFEKQGEFASAYQSYSNVENLIQKIKTKNLAEEDIYYITDVLQLVESAKKRIEQLEQQVKLKWNHILVLRNSNKYEESFRETMGILNDSRLSKTAFAKNVKVAIYVSSSPQGAKIKNSKLTTPCFYELTGAETITLTHSSFQDLAVNISLESAFFHFEMQKKKIWEKSTDARIATSPIVIENLLLVVNTRGSVVALEKDTGKEVWEFKTRKGFGDILGGVTHFDQNIYLGSNDYYLYCVNIKNGQSNWAFKTEYFIQSTPAIDEKNVFFGTDKGDVYSLDRVTGQKVWQNKIPGSVTAKPIIWRREVIFATSGYLTGLDLFTGKVKWQKELPGKVIVDPVFREEIVYFVTDRKYIYCFDIERKEKIWHKQLEARIEAPATLWGKNVYVHDIDGFLYCIQAKEGNTEWKKNIEVVSRSALAISSDKNTMYTTNTKGNIISLDFEGNIVWSDRLLNEKTHSYVLTTNKTLYFFAQTGQIYALQD